MKEDLKVLFVSRSTRLGKPSPIVEAQGASVADLLSHLDYFIIKRGGVFGYLSEAFRLSRFLKRHQVDILHAHYGLSALVSLLGGRKKKLVVSFMGTDVLGIKDMDRSLIKLSVLISKLSSSIVCRYYDHCIVKSSEMDALVKCKHKSLIPNGVDVNIFKPDDKAEARKKLNFHQEDNIVIFVSDPNRPEKNFLLAQKAVQLMNLPNIKLLTVYGLPQSELVSYYNAADVLILTSLYEGSPNVIKEAMACNTPIVSTDVGDVKWVMNQVEGCYLSSFNPDDFASKLTNALDFGVTHYKTNGRKRIIELGLDSETIAKKIIRIYERLYNTS